jgi:membrane-associated phospholipid phosphatase
VAFPLKLYGQESIEYHDAIEKPGTLVPFLKVFHEFGKNALYSITYNYGLNWIVAIAGTYGFIKTGFDWQYNRLAYHNPALAYMGFPAVYIGFATPLLTPGLFYFIGRTKLDEKMQITGLALTQSLVLTLAYVSIMKGITGRISPGIIDVVDHTRNNDPTDYSADFAWGFGKRGIIAGWPSGHTANAFAAAATISEIYRDTTWLKVISYAYATCIGLGVSLCVHWSSEVFVGALIGYAIGKAVGHSFNRLLGNYQNQNNRITYYISPHSVGLRMTF